jgi:glycosyltransferase involved in cell wall biosynthesis
MRQKLNSMKVSILVPVYRVEKYIERCARSLFEQTYDDIEYVFVDDCSPDRSIDILKSILNDYPARKQSVKIVHHEKNRGLAVARNTAIDAAKGEFVVWVDSDDYVDTSMIEKVIAKQKECDADIVCFDTKVIYANRLGHFFNADYLGGHDFTCKILTEEAPHQLWGHFIRRTLYSSYDIKAIEDINQSEDFYVMSMLAYYSKIVASLHESLYIYDMSNQNSYSNNFSSQSERQIKETFRILHVFFSDKGQDFNYSLSIGEIRSIAFRMKNLSIIDNDKELYDNLVRQLDLTDKSLWKYVPGYNRMVFYLKRKKYVKMYTLLLAFCKKVMNLR